MPNVSEVSICNQALSWLGQVPITSLEDNSTTAELCKANYEQLRAAVLEERMWTFATVRAVSETQDRDAWDSAYVHPKPLEWLSVFRVYRSTSSTNLIKDESWRMEGGNILSQWSSLYLWGVVDVVTPSRFSPLFTQALAARIAADLAIALTENRNTQADMWNLYQRKLADAAVRDGQQGSNESVISNSLIEARGGGYG